MTEPERLVDFREWPLFADLRENSRDTDDEQPAAMEWTEEPSLDDLDADAYWSEPQSTRVDAGGDQIRLDLLDDLAYEAERAGNRITGEEWAYVLHPIQLRALRASSHFEQMASLGMGVPTSGGGVTMLANETMPRSAVLLLDRNAITLAGEPIHRDRIVRLTGLDPDPTLDSGVAQTYDGP